MDYKSSRRKYVVQRRPAYYHRIDAQPRHPMFVYAGPNRVMPIPVTRSHFGWSVTPVPTRNDRKNLRPTTQIYMHLTFARSRFANATRRSRASAHVQAFVTRTSSSSRSGSTRNPDTRCSKACAEPSDPPGNAIPPRMECYSSTHPQRQYYSNRCIP